MSQELLQKIACEITKRYQEMYPTKLDFSYAADVDEKTIRRVLNGSQNISILLLHNICSALGISIYELFQSIELAQQEQN
jgi:transcriptional regulator with XRE-family HTH domain